MFAHVLFRSERSSKTYAMARRRFNKPLQPRIEVEDSGAIEKQHENKHCMPSLQSCLQTGTAQGFLLWRSESALTLRWDRKQEQPPSRPSLTYRTSLSLSAPDLHGHVLKAPENWERPGKMISNGVTQITDTEYVRPCLIWPLAAVSGPSEGLAQNMQHRL